MAKAPLLTLNTIESVFIDIDGAAYELIHPDAFPVGMARRYLHTVNKMLRLARTETPTADEEREFSEACDQVCRMILKAPDEVHAKLRDSQRFTIYQTFSGLSTKKPHPGSPNLKGLTTARRSRGSRGSTASGRKNSSGSRRASSTRTS